MEREPHKRHVLLGETVKAGVTLELIELSDGSYCVYRDGKPVIGSRWQKGQRARAEHHFHGFAARLAAQ